MLNPVRRFLLQPCYSMFGMSAHLIAQVAAIVTIATGLFFGELP